VRCTLLNSLNPALSPRRGQTLRIIVVCRISTEHQDERSLADQEALYREWLDRHWDGEVEITVLASQGSGESLIRDDYTRLLELVDSRRFDLVLTEDLGRICRRVHAHLFCEACEDAETRCIAINDNVDTAQDEWRMASFFAVMRHESYNRDTSRRIRRTKRNRFQNGGIWQCPIYGYIKPIGSTSINDIRKDPESEPVVERIFTMLEGGASYAEVADWLNRESVPTGPYRRSDTWTGKMVGQYVRHPALKGQREWNNRTTRRQNSTGVRRTVPASPEELLIRIDPHLAFVTAERFDRLQRILEQRNRLYRRHEVDGCDPRAGVPKRRTTWPSQHMTCGVCGETFIFGGHGRAGHIFCRGVPAYTCWNATSVSALDAGTRIATRILEEIEFIPEFDQAFQEEVHQEAQRLELAGQQTHSRIAAQLKRLEREESRITDAIRSTGFLPALGESLQRIQSERDRLEFERDQLQEREDTLMHLPTMEEIRRIARAAIAEDLPTSPEFGRCMHRLVTRLIAVPYQVIDGGLMVLRAFVEIDLIGLCSSSLWVTGALPQFRRRFVVDLFDPPQRAMFREQVMELREQNLTFTQIGE